MTERSTRRILVLLVLAGFLAGCAPRRAPEAPRPEGKTVVLEYGYRTGERYRVTTEVRAVFSASSEEPESAPVLAALTGASQRTTVVVDQTVEARQEGDGLQLRATLASVAMSLDMDGDPRPLPPGSVPDGATVTWLLPLGPRGPEGPATIEGGVPAGLDAAALTETMARSLPELPGRPLAVGDSFSWTTESRLPSTAPAADDGAARMTLAATYTLREIRRESAVFALSTHISGSGGEPDAALRVEGEGTGTARFDLGAGYFSEWRLEQPLRVTAALPAPVSVTASLRMTSLTEPAAP